VASHFAEDLASFLINPAKALEDAFQAPQNNAFQRTKPAQAMGLRR
jgi:hypothetical protein